MYFVVWRDVFVYFVMVCFGVCDVFFFIGFLCKKKESDGTKSRNREKIRLVEVNCYF